jgi:hypothetical protein
MNDDFAGRCSRCHEGNKVSPAIHGEYCAYCVLFFDQFSEYWDRERDFEDPITIEEVAEFCYQLETYNRSLIKDPARYEEEA